MFTRGYPKIPTKSHFSDVRCVIPGLAIASPLHDPCLAALQPFQRLPALRRQATRLEDGLLEPKAGGSPFPCDEGLRFSGLSASVEDI